VARVSSRAAIASPMVLYLRFKMCLPFLSMRANHLLFDASHWMWWSRFLGSLMCITGAQELSAGPAESGTLSAIAFTLASAS